MFMRTKLRTSEAIIEKLNKPTRSRVAHGIILKEPPLRIEILFSPNLKKKFKSDR